MKLSNPDFAGAAQELLQEDKNVSQFLKLSYRSALVNPGIAGS